jgi:hypothetical protein
VLQIAIFWRRRALLRERNILGHPAQIPHAHDRPVRKRAAQATSGGRCESAPATQPT